MMLSTMVMARAIPASSVGLRYHPASSPVRDGVRSSFGVSEYTSPASSDAGFGRVATVTAMLTAMSTTNAAPAPTNAPPWPGNVHTPDWVSTNTTTAAAVPLARPLQPAAGDMRRQNRPRMNVANSGALKNEN